jgi:hypothetical protein
MIPSSISQGVTTLQLLASVDAAATANATSAAGVDISDYEGYLIVTQNVGLLDGGSLTGKVITSASSDLSDPSDVASFTQVTTSTDPAAQSLSIQVSDCKKYIGYVGTIVTGGAIVGCTAVGVKKYA